MFPPNSTSCFQSRRGAVLIVAMLISAVIALMLGSYLSLNLTSTRLAFRSFQNHAAVNLVEAGAEEALWSFNRDNQGQVDAWTGWTTSGSAAWKKFTGFDFTKNTTGWVKVYVSDTQPSGNVSPKIVALSSVNPPNAAPATRMMEITLRQRSYFSNGLVAKDTITFNGNNTTVDSWNSDPDNDPNTAPIDYDPDPSNGIRLDGGTVASVSVQNTAVLLNQADIWGYVYTGGAQPQVGNQGSIRGETTPVGVKIDPDRVATDFNADFLSVTNPTGGTTIPSIGPSLGVLGTKTAWRCSSLSLTGNNSLMILGDVTLVLTAPSGSSALSMAGNAQIIIPSGSSLTIYTEGEVTIAGQGLANNNIQPSSFQLWGTNQSVAGQNIQISGNGALRSIVYAPNADVKINGNGDVMGSVVARTITLVGNAAFHYDEALENFGDNSTFGVDKWRELTTPAQKATYENKFHGW